MNGVTFSVKGYKNNRLLVRGVRTMLDKISLGQRVYRNYAEGMSERYTVIGMLGKCLMAKSDTYTDEIIITPKDLAEQKITPYPIYPCYDYYVPDMADFSLQ